MDEKTRTRVGWPDDPREGLEAVVALRRTLEDRLFELRGRATA
jgi:hypothetical protein